MSSIVNKYKEYSQNTPGRVLKIISVINCVTYSMSYLSLVIVQKQEIWWFHHLQAMITFT